MSSVLKRPTETMHGTLIGADFPADTITLEMEPGYYTAKMRFSVVPADEYSRLCKQRAELLEALRWYVENDDTNIGQPGNEFWELGLERARTAIANATQQRKEPGA